MKNVTKRNGRDWTKEIVEALSSGLECITKAAQIYVEAIKADPLNRSVIQSALPQVPRAAWKKFELVGRGLIYEQLLWDDQGQHIPEIRKLDMSIQKQICDGQKFELLTRDGDTLRVDVREITKEQAQQLFARDHIRSISEQKAWQVGNPPVDVEDIPVQVPWTIRGHKCTFRRSVTVDKKQLLNIAVQL